MTNFGKYVQKEHTNVNWFSHYGSQGEGFLKNFKVKLSNYHMTQPHQSWTYTGKIPSQHRDTCISVVTAAPFTTARKSSWLTYLCSIDTIEFYSGIERHEAVQFAGKWTGEVNESQEDKCQTFPLMCGSRL